MTKIDRLTVISLGAGVQSTTMALMAAAGELTPMPDCAIFADTQWEPKAVYDHLAWLEERLPFPVHRVSAGNLREDTLARRNTTSGRFAAVPWHITGPDGKAGMGRRQCTSEYKLKPIMHKLRDLLGLGRRSRIPPETVEMWIGISTDEAIRMKPARQQWIRNRWPLIEVGVSRHKCLAWMADHHYPTPPKSACIGCPFHSNVVWRDMRDNHPDEWADAVEIDKALRNGNSRGIRATEYMHPQRVPLDKVDLRTAEDKGQLNLFINECEGMCGV